MEPEERVRAMNPLEFRDAVREMRSDLARRKSQGLGPVDEAEFARSYFLERYAFEGELWKATSAAARARALAGHLGEKPLGKGDGPSSGESDDLAALLEAAATCPLADGDGFDPALIQREAARRRAAMAVLEEAIRAERDARRR